MGIRIQAVCKSPRQESARPIFDRRWDACLSVVPVPPILLVLILRFRQPRLDLALRLGVHPVPVLDRAGLPRPEERTIPSAARPQVRPAETESATDKRRGRIDQILLRVRQAERTLVRLFKPHLPVLIGDEGGAQDGV